MKKVIAFLLVVIGFLLINFAGLGLGSLFTNPGANSEWYEGLDKAPWTPPGWAFGAAWFTIMVCFSFFCAIRFKSEQKHTFKKLFISAWILNVLWNPVFFYGQYILTGLIVIFSLTCLIIYWQLKSFRDEPKVSLLLMPYSLWLCVATSLNAYIFLMNP